MHRKILFGIIAAVVCGLFVSAPSAQAGAVMTSASRSQSGGVDYWTFYFDPSSYSNGDRPYWIHFVGDPYATYMGNAPRTGSDSFGISITTGSYGTINNAVYVYGGTNSLPSIVSFHPDGSYSITNQ